MEVQFITAKSTGSTAFVSGITSRTENYGDVSSRTVSHLKDEYGFTDRPWTRHNVIDPNQEYRIRSSFCSNLALSSAMDRPSLSVPYSVCFQRTPRRTHSLLFLGGSMVDSNDSPQEEESPVVFIPLSVQVLTETLDFHENTFSDKTRSPSYHSIQDSEGTIPHGVMKQVFGFDPSESPFIVNGYPPLPFMADSLDDLHLPVIGRTDLEFVRTDDGLFECLGQGSFGCVFLAMTNERKEKVVVKDYVNEVVTLKMIEHEARLLRYLTDTGFVPKFVGLLMSTASCAGYSLVQEYFGDGLTLHSLLIDNDSLSKTSWIIICCQLAVGLECIHAKHVLLNDIKSDNVLVDLHSEFPQVRYIDVGLASYREGIRFGELSLHMDKYQYLAPEVCMGSFSSPLSDIYSLGYLLKQIGSKSEISELCSAGQACMEQLPIDRMSLLDLQVLLVHILRTIAGEQSG